MSDKTYMPDDLAEVFDRLHNDLVWLQVHFQWYNTLFDKGDLRLELLDYIASTFFVRLKRTLFSDLVLAIARLTDPARSGSYERLSVEQLVTRLESRDKEIGVQSSERLANIREKAKNFRVLRNDRIAHKDLETSLMTSRVPSGIEKKDIAEVLSQIGELLNEVSVFYGGPSTLYENAVSQAGADTLVERLKEAAFVREHYIEDPEYWHPTLECHKFRDA